MCARKPAPAARPRTSGMVGVIVALMVVLTGLVGLAPPATAAGATVTGRFVTEAGDPIDAIRALVVADGSVVTEVTSGADGRFEIPGVPAGSYTLHASDLFGNYGFGSGTPITLTEGETEALGDLELQFFTNGHPLDRLTGFVLDRAGEPVRGIRVYVRTATPFFSGSTIVASAVTDRTGFYNLPSDGAFVPGDYKLYFIDDATVPEPFGWGDRYSGDQPTWARATVVTVGDTKLDVPSVTVIRNGGIAGTLSGTVPMAGGTVTVFNADGDQVASKATGPGGAYAINTLRPGTYYARFSSPDAAPGGGAKFVRAYWPDATSLIDATSITVRSGAFRSGVDQMLSDQLVAYEEPTVSGRAVVGGTLTASPGSWSLTSGTEYSYEWLRGASVVGTKRSYRPVAADAGKELRARVTARNLDKSGTATTDATSRVKWVSTVTGDATYQRSRKKLVLTVRVDVPGLPDPGGTVTVTEGTRTIKAAAAVVDGVAVATVLRPKPGRHTFGLSYSGTAKVLADVGRLRVDVPR